MAAFVGWRGSGRGEEEPGARGSRARRPGPGASAAGATLAALVFVLPLLACVAPYARYLHTHTGEWQLTAKSQDASIEAWHTVARGDREARDRVLYALDETGLRFDGERAPLTTLARRDPAGYGRIVATNLSMLGKDLAGWWLLPLPLWGLAAWAAFRRRRQRGVAVVVAVGAMPVITALAFFVQPRYLVVTAAMTCVLVGVGVAGLRPRWRRAALAGALGLSLAASLVTFVGPAGWWHPTDHTDQQAAGEWIAARSGPGDRLMTRSFVVEHFAGRDAVAVPYTDLDGILVVARHFGVRYLAVDETSARRVRPQLLPLLGDEPVPGLRLVHESTAEGRTTRVFAFGSGAAALDRGRPRPRVHGGRGLIPGADGCAVRSRRIPGPRWADRRAIARETGPGAARSAA